MHNFELDKNTKRKPLESNLHHLSVWFDADYTAIWCISQPHLGHFTAWFKPFHSPIWHSLKHFLKLPYPTTCPKYHNHLTISNSKLLQNDIFTTWERREKQAETGETFQYFAALGAHGVKAVPNKIFHYHINQTLRHPTLKTSYKKS